MLSKHFPQSQFILISLKEGMYNHANILFKTSFIEGASKVDRIALKAIESKKGKKPQKKRTENSMEVEEEIDA